MPAWDPGTLGPGEDIDGDEGGIFIGDGMPCGLTDPGGPGEAAGKDCGLG